MSPENKGLKKKKKKLKEMKNLPIEIKGESNFDFDSSQKETLGTKKTKNNMEKKVELDSMKKKTKMMMMKKKKKKGSEFDSKNADGVEHEDLDGDRKGPAKEKKSKLGLKKKRRREIENVVDASIEDRIHGHEHAVDGVEHEDLDEDCKGPAKEKKSKLGLKKKRRREIENVVDASNEDRIHRHEYAAGNRPKSDHTKSSTQFETFDDGNSEKFTKASNGTKIKTKKAKKEMKRKNKDSIVEERKIEQTLDLVDDGNVEEMSSVDEDCSRGLKKKAKKEMKRKKKDFIAEERKIEQTLDLVDDENVEEMSSGDEDCSRGLKKKAKKEMKRKMKDFIAEERKIEQTLDLVDDGNVEEMSSVDEDCSRGLKKWLIKYKESRPGLNILQERIDDFMSAYEEQQEQERREREARAAEGGWTVVVHHKGRKKTTEAETGVTMGSVAQAAVVDKMGKKKSKEVPLDFYRFKKREAQRNEIMIQQNKFEQDKKRIQQLRSARKFRPY